jgi:hypothetical protein
MAVSLKRKSRLRFGELVSLDGFEFWNNTILPELDVQPDDLTHIVTGVDRIDSIAARYYGDPVLWWVVAVANDMEILPTALNVGDKIRIPSPRYVNSVLFTKSLVRG